MEEQKKNPAQGLSESEQVQVRRTGAIRRDGDITHGRQDATGFHRFVWIVGNAPRIGIKRGRGVSPTLSF